MIWPLVITGLILIILGSLIMGMKLDRKLKVRSAGTPVVKKILGNLGMLFFIVGLICIVAGVADLYL